MHTYIYTLHDLRSLSLSLYIYVYTYTHVIYIYIYDCVNIYICLAQDSIYTYIYIYAHIHTVCLFWEAGKREGPGGNLVLSCDISFWAEALNSVKLQTTP